MHRCKLMSVVGLLLTIQMVAASFPSGMARPFRTIAEASSVAGPPASAAGRPVLNVRPNVAPPPPLAAPSTTGTASPRVTTVTASLANANVPGVAAQATASATTHVASTPVQTSVRVQRGTAVPLGASGNNIVLTEGGTVRVTKIDNSHPYCSNGSFGLQAPTTQQIWASYTSYTGVQPGATAIVGTFTSGTALVFYIQPNYPCTSTHLLSTDSAAAKVTQLAADTWQIGFEDGGDQSYNDLTATPPRSPTTPQASSWW